MDKKLIAYKLQLDIRSIKNILRDETLCNRILAEDVQSIQEAADTSGLSLGLITKLAKTGIISCFGNKPWSKGCKMFIFTKELIPYTKEAYSKAAIWTDIRRTVELYLKIVPDLTDDERYSLMLIAEQRSCNLSTRSRTKQTLAFEKILNSSTLIADVDFLQRQKTQLEDIVSYLSTRVTTLQEKHNLTNEQLQGELALMIPLTEVGFNVRAFNIVKHCETLNNLIAYTPSQVHKFRNCGVNTLQHIQRKLQSYNLWLGYYSLPKPF